MLESGFANREERANIEAISRLPAEGCSVLQPKGEYTAVQGQRLGVKESELEYERLDSRSTWTKLGGGHIGSSK